ncbi:MAG: hypothetical protein BGO76_03160 [Caedibacter sp. 38-128]|nr:hypothetical protein [Holosporales bacterium]OJX05365.1 MAG: hypothetical protein BGO76_03160 [Caedibacter sp. 38-128]
MIKSVEKFLAASSLIFLLGTSFLVASEQQDVDLKRKLQFIQTNFLDNLTAFEGKDSQRLPKIMQLATLIDENAFATCESWLATLYPDFSLNTYKDHPLYSILEAAVAYIDFEADNAEYVTRASIKNIMAIDDYPIRGCMEEVGNAKIFVLGSLNILMGKQDLETHLQKTLLSFLGVMVKRREELFLGFNFEEYLKIPMNKRITQNFDRATEFRFGIVRTILEYMLKKDPRSLSEQLSEKTLTLLRLTPTFLKFFDRTNPFHFTSVDPNLMIETKNFLSYLKAQGKKSLGMTFEEFIVDFRINPQIFRRLKASSAFLPPIPELLRVNKLYEPSTQSVQSTAKAPTKNQRKKQKQKEREKLKKQQKLGIGNSSQVESFKDSSQEVDIDNSLVNPLLSAVVAPQLMIDKEENLTEGRPIFENKTLPEDQSAQTSSLSSYEKEKTALQAASSAVTPKVSDNNVDLLMCRIFMAKI